VLEGIENYFVEGIEVYTKTTSKDDYGADIETWTKDRDITGRLRPLRGNERFVSGAEHQISTHRVYTHDDDITENDKIKYENTEYDVVFVSNPMTFNSFYQIDLEVIK